MLSDRQMLDACPEFISVGDLLKATPHMEGDNRFLYMEASNEGLDQQGEVIAAKALAESADFYSKYGNVDIDHYTVIGAKVGIPDYPKYEIGRPVEVGQRSGSTFVKAEIFRGEGEMALKANMVWDSVTKLHPPQRWYPSVGGAVLAKSIQSDPSTGMKRAVVGKVRWTNIGLSKTPVNQHVGVCATVPMGTFAKSLTAGGLLDMTKALEAGYGTDSAGLEGGGALRKQSLDRGVKNYFDFREQLAKAMREGRAGANPRASDLASFATKEFGLSSDEGSGYVERFLRDLKTGMERKSQ